MTCRPPGATTPSYSSGATLFGDALESFREAAASRRNVYGARVGIRNEGNTCYLSSVIQALTYSPLANWLLAIEPIGEAPTASGFNVVFELAKHVRKVWALNAKCAARDAKTEGRRGMPTTTDVLIGKSLLSCSGHAGRMEDAHECLTYVLAQLLEACGVGFDGEKNEKWEKSTIVYEVFGLDLAQAVVCGSCGHSSRTPSSEMALRLNATLGLSEAEMARATRIDDSLERRLRYRANRLRDPRSDDDDDEDSEDEGGGPLASPPTSIEELMTHFFASEKIEDFECEKCKERGCCEKRGGFASLPNSLSLYVDRIPVFGALFGKSNRVVSFGQSLDLAPFLSERLGDDDEAVYHLYAVVAHLDFSGSTFFGHYVSYVRDANDTWWLLDDESVELMDWDEVKRVNPYLLFYSKVGPVSSDESDREVEEQHTVVVTPKKKKAEAEKKEATDETLQGAEYTDPYEMD